MNTTRISVVSTPTQAVERFIRASFITDTTVADLTEMLETGAMILLARLDEATTCGPLWARVESSGAIGIYQAN